MRLYRALLHLYPAGFRAEYAEDMAWVYRRRRETCRSAGDFIGLWTSVVADLFRTAVPAHLDIVRQDLRYALRGLRRSPGFALTAILVIALGIGANTAVFSLADHVLIRPLPFPQSGQLVRVFERTPEYGRMEPSPANYRDWVQMQTTMTEIGAYASTSVNLVGGGDPLRLQGAAVTASLSRVLGVAPALGRGFTDGDDQPGAPATVILSHAFWLSRFGADPGVIGRQITLNEQPHQVIGVMPADFLFPTRDTSVWITTKFDAASYEERDNHYLRVVGRLKPGTDVDRALADMTRVTAQLATAYPATNAESSANVFLLNDDVGSQTVALVRALAGAALCVLLVACTNLANLTLARAVARQTEMAVRQSLGAGRDRLARQLLTESLVVSAIGGIAGIALGAAALPLLSRLVPTALPIAEVPSLDARVLVIALGLTVITALGFGIWPVLRAGRTVQMAALRDGARAGTGRARERLRSGLVVVELAASVMLLVAAALLLQTLRTVQAVDPGFASENVVSVRTWLPLPAYAETERRDQFYQRVIDRVSSEPGVVKAAYTSFTPMVFTGGIWPVIMPGRTAAEPGLPHAMLRVVTPGYFDTLRVPVREGRPFEPADRDGRERVAIVSESFVREHWPDGQALGRTFTIAFSERRVIGVVGDIRARGLERPAEPQVYLPHRQMVNGSLPFYMPKDLLVRVSGDPMTIVPAIRRAVAEADPQQPVSDVQSLASVVAGESAPRNIQLRVIGAFAVAALLLAIVGIYGVLSFSVSQRTHEFGVRLALGARPRDIEALVFRKTLALTVLGVSIGLVGGALMTRTFVALIVDAVAPGLVAASVVALVTVITALAAGWVPARRASRLGAASIIRLG